MSTLAITPARISWITRSILGAVAAAIALGSGALALGRSSGPPAAARLVGSTEAASASVSVPSEPLLPARPPPGKAITMHFADGSDLYLIAGARGRLAGLGERGGSVVLEDGKARVAIAPRPGAQWVISAGPFLISSDGGTLDVSFSPSEAGLSVRVVSGAAVVRGPSSPGGAALRAGESLDVRGHGPISVVRSPEGDDG